MPAKTHSGLLTPKSSTIQISDTGKIESLEVVLDMDSIEVTDLEPGKMRNKLMKHLRSEDFFFVKDFPTARFTMDAHANGTLTGTIEIRGVSNPITIPVTVSGNPRRGWSLPGTFAFDRPDFDVDYQNGGFGAAKDKLIRDRVQVEVALKTGA